MKEHMDICVELALVGAAKLKAFILAIDIDIYGIIMLYVLDDQVCWGYEDFSEDQKKRNCHGFQLHIVMFDHMMSLEHLKHHGQITLLHLVSTVWKQYVLHAE